MDVVEPREGPLRLQQPPGAAGKRHLLHPHARAPHAAGALGSAVAAAAKEANKGNAKAIGLSNCNADQVLLYPQ